MLFVVAVVVWGVIVIVELSMTVGAVVLEIEFVLFVVRVVFMRVFIAVEVRTAGGEVG